MLAATLAVWIALGLPQQQDLLTAPGVLDPPQASQPPVDLVYTWVGEPSTDAFAQILQTCSNDVQTLQTGDTVRMGEGGMTTQRFRDLDTFRHALRSASMFLPWVRTIFVVTNGVFPCWLKETGKIRFVRHEDIFPDHSHLPTFHSQAIEVNLHRIPGLSELFIYANDDFLFAKPISRDHFFGGTPLAPRRHTARVLKGTAAVQPRQQIPEATVSKHCPHALSISCIKRVWQSDVQRFNRTSATKCRTLWSKRTSPIPTFAEACATAPGETHDAQTLNYISCASADPTSPCLKENSTVGELADRLLTGGPDFVTLNDNFTEDASGYAHFRQALQGAQDVVWHAAADFEDDAGCSPGDAGWDEARMARDRVAK